MSDTTPSIFSLPAEVIEHIFIAASSNASARSIAALAETCKAFHAIIYHAPDHHLWRGIFLAAFDDPRPALRHTAVLHRGARHDDPHGTLQAVEDAYDWAREYQRRVKAKSVLARAAKRRTDVKDLPLRVMRHRAGAVTDEVRAHLAGGATPAEAHDVLDALRALLAALETATPFPRFPSIKFEVQGLLADDEDEASLARAPPFPPLLLLLCSDEFPESMQCRNADWVESILFGGDGGGGGVGFPPQLVRTLLANKELHVEGCADFTPNLEQPTYWTGPAHDLGQAFHKLLCCTGFIPIRQPESPKPASKAEDAPKDAAVDEPAHIITGATESTGQTEDSTTAPTEETDASSSSSPAPGITMEEPTPVADDDGGDGDEETGSGGVYGLSILHALEYTSSHSLKQRFPSAEKQHTEARSLARRRVYDMRYLHPARQWGPYLPVKRAPRASSSAAGKGKARDSADGDGTESSDGEYVPPPATTHQAFAEEDNDALTEENSDDDPDPDEAETESDNDADNEGLHALPLAHNLRPLRPPIQPYELAPDWVWLASARIVVEANLGEMYQRSAAPDRLALGDILHALRRAQATRVGSSPGFWNEWARQRGEGDAKGKAKGRETAQEGEASTSRAANGRTSVPTPKLTGDPEDLEECEGWDWAGIEGIWRRCICWLDYRDLLLHNVSSQRFLDESTREACRMVPMTARITKYTRAPQPPTTNDGDTAFEYPPIIHIEGESIGSDRDPRAPRRNWGKVMMLADGSIRWHMVRSVVLPFCPVFYPVSFPLVSHRLAFLRFLSIKVRARADIKVDLVIQETRTPGSDDPEWSSEAIQIGGPGAASGWLGCWTGAQHERPDPLGPFWAWKVG
ncbi:hypothetical protein CONPUDRAFT_167696 [Coniophora puteana RWD-64-598 SS2]|uniref:F-box domain-containing protein n=1 Tax=Coniophora puteana (strain RWD-64-598) TaxID=741705 RepID=A0A5M3MFW3_CONPW|nr:uncharacterized protein CONPUDRAFT_167696 [Coniophora puteana RWD-64-598 SS2]EIW77505.1 hypothetical protein CONPUDRAFT_167696 [Coniophora puteana RWD-64-598 SS2]